jgi:hypothetical protein
MPILLQTVLRGSNSCKIMECYSRLARVDQRVAASYNPEVEFHFRIVNMKKREFKSKGLVSSVWDYPAMMENPVNFQTKIIAENIFDYTKVD